MNKIVGIIVKISIFAICFFVFAYFFIFPHPDAPTDTTTTNNTSTFAAPQVWDDWYISGQILQWLESDMKDGRGVYMPTQSGMAVIWANYSYWLRTGDIAALERMKTGLTVYADRDILEYIHTDNLSCYYLRPIALDDNPAIRGRERQNALFTCFETEYINAIDENVVAPPMALLLEEIGYKANLIMGYEEIAHVNNSAFPFRPEGENLTIIPHSGWIDLATEFIVRYQLDPREHRLDLARAYYIGALDAYLNEPEPNNLTCPLLLASQEFCDSDGELGEAACQLVSFLGNKAISLIESGDNFIGIENLAKCALALPLISEYFVEHMRIYYYSEANSNDQHTEPWLLNDYRGYTKNALDNALFAGMLMLAQ